MAKASWNDTVIAEAVDVVIVEGNVYFPADSVRPEFLAASDTHTTCPWKGEASYYNVVVGDKTNADAAWYYPAPKDAAKQITGRIAFWKGVVVER